MQWLIDMTFRRASRCFVAGIIAILPLVITVAVVTWAGGFVSQFLGPSTVIGKAMVGVGLRFATNTTAAYAIGAGACSGGDLPGGHSRRCRGKELG